MTRPLSIAGAGLGTVGAGVVTLLLGAMIIAQWPASGIFVLGIFLGIDLIFIGSGWITMGMALRKRA